jgi:hypothetical protein
MSVMAVTKRTIELPTGGLVSAKYSPLMYEHHAFRCPPSRAWFKPSASDV